MQKQYCLLTYVLTYLNPLLLAGAGYVETEQLHTKAISYKSTYLKNITAVQPKQCKTTKQLGNATIRNKANRTGQYKLPNNY